MGHARKGVLMDPFLKTALGKGQGGGDDPLVKCYKHEDSSLDYLTLFLKSQNSNSNVCLLSEYREGPQRELIGQPVQLNR